MPGTPRRPLRRAAPAALACVLAAAVLLSGCGSHHADVPAAPVSSFTPTPTQVVASPAALKSYRYAITLTVAAGALNDVTGANGQSRTAHDRQATPTAAAGSAATATPTATPQPFKIDITGEVVNPNRQRSETKASLGFIQLTVDRVEIGTQAWTREAGGAWQQATPGASSPASLGTNVDISPARLFAQNGLTFAALNRELGSLPSTQDSVNGVQARRYDLTAEEFHRIFSSAQGLLPGDTQPVQTTGSVWIANATKVPVRLRLNSTSPDGKPAFQMDMTLSDLNGSLSIQPPA